MTSLHDHRWTGAQILTRTTAQAVTSATARKTALDIYTILYSEVYMNGTQSADSSTQYPDQLMWSVEMQSVPYWWNQSFGRAHL